MISSLKLSIVLSLIFFLVRNLFCVLLNGLDTSPCHRTRCSTHSFLRPASYCSWGKSGLLPSATPQLPEVEYHHFPIELDFRVLCQLRMQAYKMFHFENCYLLQDINHSWWRPQRTLITSVQWKLSNKDNYQDYCLKSQWELFIRYY